MYLRSVLKKNPMKNTSNFEKYKKANFWQKDILFYYYITIYCEKFVFFTFPKIQHIFNGIFLHALFLYVSIYIVNTIIFENLKVWGFKILKVKGALLPTRQRHFVHLT
jgi:cellulose synthase/poly-beta-1,6-N-acetylglucosamine synthase-like glycosyltransferase